MNPFSVHKNYKGNFDYYRLKGVAYRYFGDIENEEQYVVAKIYRRDDDIDCIISLSHWTDPSVSNIGLMFDCVRLFDEAPLRPLYVVLENEKVNYDSDLIPFAGPNGIFGTEDNHVVAQ